MDKCPDCKGEKVFRTWWPYPWTTEEEGGHWIARRCMFCAGEGMVSPLKLALWKAGYEPSVKTNGFA